jgi:hypothetical protein
MLRIGDPVDTAIAVDVPPGPRGTGPVGALVEVEHRGPALRCGADVVVGQDGEVTAAPLEPAGSGEV